MSTFPTSYEIFGLDSLGEDASDIVKMEYLFNCIDECVSETLMPYKDIFEKETFRFEAGKMERSYGPAGYVFNEDDSTTPINCPMSCNPFVKLKGSKYEKLLCANHFIEPAPNDDRDNLEPIGLELDFAENPIDGNWEYYSDIDEKSYQRVVCCYREAAEDGNLNAMWCLGSALNRRYSDFYLDYFGLTYHYYTTAIQRGHLACIPSLCEKLMQDGMHKEAFMFTYIGAQKQEIYCMWNLAMYYLCGAVVPKSEDKALDLFKSILDIINQTDSEKSDFYKHHYDGVNENNISKFKKDIEQNLMVINNKSDAWRKYFDMDIIKKYNFAYLKIMQESFKDPSITNEMIMDKVKALMQQ